MSDIHSIRSDADLEKALARIEEIFFAEEGTSEESELEDLVSKVRTFEAGRFPRAIPVPVEAVKFMMEQGAYLPEDLASSAANRSEILEVLAGTRPLSFEMAQTFSERLAIPIEILWPHSEHPEELISSAEDATLPAVGSSTD